MQRLKIICVDDQREVLTALDHDLEELADPYEVLLCESASEAYEELEEADAEGGLVAVVVCDQVMPERSGVDFLSQINTEGRFCNIRKILLTGLATHRDAIDAINKAGVDLYIEKPWQAAHLLQAVRTLATRYVFAVGIDYQPYAAVLDQQTLYEELHQGL
jgi:two-component system, chemotaxis family, chemotaxis protein CheY